MRVAGAVPVQDLAQLLRSGCYVVDQGVHRFRAVQVRGTEDLDPGCEPIHGIRKPLPVVFDPIPVTALGVGDLNHPVPRVGSPLTRAKLGHLFRGALPAVLRVKDEVLGDGSPRGAQPGRNEMVQDDLASQTADVLEARDGKARVADDCILPGEKRLNRGIELVEPVHPLSRDASGPDQGP